MVLDLWLLAWRAAYREVRGRARAGRPGAFKAPGSRVASIAVHTLRLDARSTPDDD
jgi:hypothetical protein